MKKYAKACLRAKNAGGVASVGNAPTNAGDGFTRGMNEITEGVKGMQLADTNEETSISSFPSVSGVSDESPPKAEKQEDREKKAAEEAEEMKLAEYEVVTKAEVEEDEMDEDLVEDGWLLL